GPASSRSARWRSTGGASPSRRGSAASRGRRRTPSGTWSERPGRPATRGSRLDAHSDRTSTWDDLLLPSPIPLRPGGPEVYGSPEIGHLVTRARVDGQAPDDERVLRARPARVRADAGGRGRAACRDRRRCDGARGRDNARPAARPDPEPQPPRAARLGPPARESLRGGHARSARVRGGERADARGQPRRPRAVRVRARPLLPPDGGSRRAPDRARGRRARAARRRGACPADRAPDAEPAGAPPGPSPPAHGPFRRSPLP